MYLGHRFTCRVAFKPEAAQTDEQICTSKLYPSYDVTRVDQCGRALDDSGADCIGTAAFFRSGCAGPQRDPVGLFEGERP